VRADLTAWILTTPAPFYPPLSPKKGRIKGEEKEVKSSWEVVLKKGGEISKEIKSRFWLSSPFLGFIFCV
jgi:hypothetical protein